MATTSTTLYSIGHSNVAAERLIALLQQHGIRTLCDVRSAPYSRYNPQFNRENLAETLRTTSIAYRFMGDTRGGKPADGALRTEDGALADYTKIAASPDFQRGLNQLIDLGQRAPTAFMCGEADYHGCHRHRAEPLSSGHPRPSPVGAGADRRPRTNNRSCGGRVTAWS